MDGAAQHLSEPCAARYTRVRNEGREGNTYQVALEESARFNCFCSCLRVDEWPSISTSYKLIGLSLFVGSLLTEKQNATKIIASGKLLFSCEFYIRKSSYRIADERSMFGGGFEFFPQRKKVGKDEAVRKERASTGSQLLLC